MTGLIANRTCKLGALAALWFSLTAQQCQSPGTSRWTFKGLVHEGSASCYWIDSGFGTLYGFHAFEAAPSQRAVRIQAEAFIDGAVRPGTYVFSNGIENTLDVYRDSPEHFSYQAVSGQVVISTDADGALHAAYEAVVRDGTDEQPISGELTCPH
ncbi:MAG TPA: hypothetical protein VI072_02735 [Polyangiaceae bacterium]